MGLIVFNATDFRALFPAYASTTAYPNSVLELFWDTATNYVSNSDSVPFYGALSAKARAYALNLMTAHLACQNDKIATGAMTGVQQSATVGNVSVSFVAPPTKNNLQWWLSQTPYGQQLLALIASHAAGGVYIGGRNEVGAFRRSYGV